MSDRAPGPAYSTRTKLIVAGTMLVAGAAFTAAIVTADADGPAEVSRSGSDQIGGGQTGTTRLVIVEELSPDRGDEALSQQSIQIDLAAGFAVSTFQVNGITIPASELDLRPELAITSFTPDEGKAVEELDAGTNCVSAVIYRLADGRGINTRTERWCFEVT